MAAQLMYLVDTNIWLERLLAQERSDEVGSFLNAVGSDRLFITDFSFHSICVILARLHRLDTLTEFADDLFLNGGIALLTVAPTDLRVVVEVMSTFKLDFEDAYQYVAAEQHDLMIVTFDSDFNQFPDRKLTREKLLRVFEFNLEFNLWQGSANVQ